MKVPFLDLAADYAAYAEPIEERVLAVLRSGAFVLGPETAGLEESMVRRTGAEHAVACSSGSDALFLALAAMGIGPGDAVALPAFTFFATAGAVVRTGAVPTFLDIDPHTHCMGPAELAQCIGAALDERDGALVDRRSGAVVKAVIPVHLYGRAVDMAGIDDFLAPLEVRPKILEDAAQAIGAKGNVAAVGAWGDAAAFSFYPTKNLGGAGDAGAVTTRDAELAASMAALRTHGASGGAYHHESIGINARVGELQAAVLNVKMRGLDCWIERRRDLAQRYRERLADLEGAGGFRLPAPADEQAHVYHQFTVTIPENRDAVAARLADDDIQSRVFYPLPLHMQPCFVHLRYVEEDVPVSASAARTVLCLPIHPALTDEQIDFVCERLSAAIRAAA